MRYSDIALASILGTKEYFEFLPLLPSHRAGIGSTCLPAFACFAFFSESPQIKIDELGRRTRAELELQYASLGLVKFQLELFRGKLW